MRERVENMGNAYDAKEGARLCGKGRVDQNEIAIQRVQWKAEGARRTFEQLKEERRKAITDDMVSKFANYTNGIHGKELPKHAETNKEWYKNVENFKEMPDNSSLKKL